VHRAYYPDVGWRRYDGLADEYDAFVDETSPFYALTTQALRRLLGGGDGRCLDVGCGGGHVLDVPIELGWQPVGIDASRDQLRVARRRHPRVDFVLADAARLPFADESFDASFSTFTPHRLRQLRRSRRGSSTRSQAGWAVCLRRQSSVLRGSDSGVPRCGRPTPPPWIPPGRAVARIRGARDDAGRLASAARDVHSLAAGRLPHMLRWIHASLSRGAHRWA
jgi:SAM-dependent methyltransferase